jgi:fluoroquinolone resistance protein
MHGPDPSTLPPGTLVEGQTFVDIDIGRVAGLEFFNCRFERCRFVEATLSRCVFERCVFDGCDLTRVRLGQSGLRGVHFVDSKLLGVEFAGAADNPEMHFERCVLRHAAFHGVSLRGVRFSGACQLQEASFLEADLQDVDLADSDLERATFRRCGLGGADFSGASGVWFEPAQNQAKDALISVETAVHLARAAGLRVAGHDAPRGARRGARRR